MRFKDAWRSALTAAAVLLTVIPALRAADPPKVRIESVRRVFHNGEHNAFTDLIQLQGSLLSDVSELPGRPYGLPDVVDHRALERGRTRLEAGQPVQRA